MIRVLEFADVINKADFIDTIVQFADPAEFEVSVCVPTNEHNIARPEFAGGVKYELLPGNSRRDAPATAWKLAGLLREWKIDILHAHHFEQAVVGWMAVRLAPGTRLVIGRHYSDAIYRNSSSMKRRSLLAVEQIINRSARRIIVPSKFIFDILTERQKVNADKIDVVLYGFDPEKYSSVKEAETARVRSELGLDGRVVFGNFSRLHEEKGHRYLIEAARSVVRDIPEAVVLIVGEGQERAALEDQIAANGLEANVKLLGWRRDAMAIMSAVDVVVQSTLQEAFSQVMCEALWLGKPLIIPEVSGAVDIIDKDKGRLIKKADASALADAMIDLARNRLERARLGENGRAFVSRELTIDKMIGHYESSFRKAIAE